MVLYVLTETYLDSSRTSTMELFSENSQQLKAVNYFCKKPDRRLNMPLTNMVKNNLLVELTFKGTDCKITVFKKNTINFRISTQNLLSAHIQ